MNLLFLDTEWADPEGTELVSLGLVSEDGAREFYAERAQLYPTPTPFVRDVVYPLLYRGAAALSDSAMTDSLHEFLLREREPCVLADYPNDLKLLRCVLDGFDLRAISRSGAAHGPWPVTTRMFTDGLTSMLIEDWFEAHEAERARRHHALVDARALRMAWRVATGRVQAPEWAKTLATERR